MKAMAVTGYIRNAFPAKHLSVEQFVRLGERLKAAIPGKIHAFDGEDSTLKDCWAWPLMEENPSLLPSDSNPPADRYLEPRHAAISNIVLLQRYEWMRRCGELYPDVDVFAWIEYSVLKQRNVTEQVIQQFMQQLEATSFDAVSLPGVWQKGPIDDSQAHWRFCGSCWVCPRKYLDGVFNAVRAVATLRTRMTGKISWDMNTMAYVELLDVLPIRWYLAGHDQTQFTNYSLTPLCELARKYQTDKGGWHLMYGGAHGDTCHNYTPAYYEMLKSRREDVRRVLEIGVHTGSSLRMWREFFPNARIFGIDINPNSMFKEDRISCALADQSSRESLLNAMKTFGPEPFDLIIEDGSHELQHQVVTANALLPFVAKNGFYVVEDIDYDCKPELVSKGITPLSGEFELRYVKTGKGIGKAQCNAACPHCKGAEGECLIVYYRR